MTLRTALTTSCVPVRLHPNVMPPSLMFGHEMLSSIAATPSSSDRMRATSQYSSMRRAADVDDDHGAPIAQLRQLLARRTGARRCPAGRSRSACRTGVSTMRGGGCPSRSARNSPLTATPPSDDEIDDVGCTRRRSRSSRWRRSADWRASATPIETDEIHDQCPRQRVPDDAGRVEHRALDAGSDEVRRAGRRRGRGRRSCSSRRGRSP